MLSDRDVPFLQSPTKPIFDLVALRDRLLGRGATIPNASRHACPKWRLAFQRRVIRNGRGLIATPNPPPSGQIAVPESPLWHCPPPTTPSRGRLNRQKLTESSSDRRKAGASWKNVI